MIYDWDYIIYNFWLKSVTRSGRLARGLPLRGRRVFMSFQIRRYHSACFQDVTLHFTGDAVRVSLAAERQNFAMRLLRTRLVTEFLPGYAPIPREVAAGDLYRFEKLRPVGAAQDGRVERRVQLEDFGNARFPIEPVQDVFRRRKVTRCHTWHRPTCHLAFQQTAILGQFPSNFGRQFGDDNAVILHENRKPLSDEFLQGLAHGDMADTELGCDAILAQGGPGLDLTARDRLAQRVGDDRRHRQNLRRCPCIPQLGQ